MKTFGLIVLILAVGLGMVWFVNHLAREPARVRPAIGSRADHERAMTWEITKAEAAAKAGNYEIAMCWYRAAAHSAENAMLPDKAEECRKRGMEAQRLIVHAHDNKPR